MPQPDDDRFREFVTSRSASLIRTAYLLVGERGKAEDLLQTALLKTYLAWGRIDAGAVDAYVRRVMATTAVSWWRRRWSQERPTASPPDWADTDDPYGFAEAEEMRQHLMTLPARQRAVLVLRYYDDMAEADIAETLGISRGSVSSYTARGLAALRARLRQEVEK